MRLQKLTSLETDKLIEEYNELQKQIIYFNDILNNKSTQNYKEELVAVDENMEMKERQSTYKRRFNN